MCRGDCAKWLWSRQRPHFRLQRLNSGRNSSCTEPPQSRLRESDALIVKSYATSTSEMQLGTLIGGGFAVVEESKTR